MKTISRRQFLRKNILGMTVFFFPPVWTEFSSPKRPFRRLVILYSYGLGSNPDLNLVPQGEDNRIRLLVARAQWVDRIRAEGHTVIYIDGGDLISLGLESDFLNHTPELLFLKEIKCDAIIPGEFELALGIDRWEKIAAENKFFWLACNYLIYSSPLQDYVKPFMVLNRSGIRIGIIGVGMEGRSIIATEDEAKIEFMHPLHSLNNAATQLKRRGCELVICFLHGINDFSEGSIKEIMSTKEIQNIDLVIGCHGNNSFQTPRLYTNKFGKNTLYTQLLGQENYLGRIDLFLPEKGGNKTLSFNEIITVKKNAE
jgi:5'-nucleotidase